jgi:Glycosyl transferase family 90
MKHWGTTLLEDCELNDFVERVVAHSSPKPPNAGAILSDHLTSRLFADWDGSDLVLRRDGSRWQIALEGDTRTLRFAPKEDFQKILRIVGVLNEVLDLGRAQPLRIDMQDSRRFGESDGSNPERVILTYNRRSEARNVALWPLPHSHSIGTDHFAREDLIDHFSFDEKQDRCVWRGNLTGRANFHYPSRGPIGRSSHAILADLLKRPPGAVYEDLLEELRGLPRFQVMERLGFASDYDLAFTLPRQFAALASSSFLSINCDTRRTRAWLNRFRYALCLSGHDTGSNFFDIACSNSVMLKEEDGWELFYSASFHPWEHYIPLERGAGNVEEMLDWARANPAACREMVSRRQSVVRRFASKELRHLFLNGILDKITSQV